MRKGTRPKALAHEVCGSTLQHLAGCSTLHLFLILHFRRGDSPAGQRNLWYYCCRCRIMSYSNIEYTSDPAEQIQNPDRGDYLQLFSHALLTAFATAGATLGSKALGII